jgi:hypothetical protein
MITFESQNTPRSIITNGFPEYAKKCKKAGQKQKNASGLLPPLAKPNKP